MPMIQMLVAAALAAGPAAAAKEASEAPKERKVCRTVQMSGRITPQRICRKVKPRAAQEETRRDARDSADSPKGED